ncbi:MAG: sigma 54-dependent Fis family transcriptional regulator [Deltaproteobacteria bacterium]|nr:sigma 54-dependent Fis family transcriptional regulator [Deltaproteobacteria bacterium]MBI2501168.1 sigma 54-dependent Fis family transcriptional regulator [Deltaproteobacteria bacterium]MBI4197149.1 sigma 54-dependent Fis family transcriptional regulator [Deltaproteobacteria bacterium]
MEKQSVLDTDTALIGKEDQKDLIFERKCQLIIVEGPGKGKKLALTQPRIRIGKRETNEFMVEDTTVSRNHLEILQADDSYLLKDLNSTNGTYINDIRVKEAYLAPGDIIRIGNTRIEFVAFDEKVQIEPSSKNEFGLLVGRSRKMRQIFGILEKISPTNATVIIEGETGTGKEVVARAIHQNSARKAKPFVVFDCSSVAQNLIESELFGHVKGAFTGAVTTRRGAFEEANGGTIFLDEIGELSLDLQPKLLRALEQREVKKVGSNETASIDVRVICATNRSLRKEISEGRFREDLYYRLSVVKFHIPPLRERPDDIPFLIEKFLGEGKFNKMPDGKLRVTRVEDDALKMLTRYQWPGNVREMINVLERIVPLVEGSSITGQNISYIFQEMEKDEEEATERMSVDMGLPFKEAKQKVVEVFEKDYLAAMLRRNNYNISKTAREAGIDRKHIRNLLKKYGIIGEDEPDSP